MKHSELLPIAAVTLTASLGITACGLSQPTTVQYDTPNSLAAHEGVSVLSLIDTAYATKDCLTNTSYDPARTDGKLDATVSAYQWGSTDYALLTPAGGNKQNAILFTVENNVLVPNDGYSMDTVKGYKNCPNTK